MPDSFPHLSIGREQPVTERRPSGGFPPPPPPPDDTRAHGERLRNRLETAVVQTDEDLGGFDDRRIFRFSVQEGFNADNLRHVAADIELVSEENETVIIGFASDAALADFESRLATLVRGEEPTYKHVLYALESVDGWSRRDRIGWALNRHGFPEAESFVLDVELWPLEGRSQQQHECTAFEDWLGELDIEQLDSVRHPALTIYRVRCDRTQAEQLLRHRDVRTVDLPPQFGIELELLGRDMQDIPPIEDPGTGAPGIVVLDSGLASGHPLIQAAVGEARSFLPGEGPADEHGHGTLVAGLALYGDVEECLRLNQFVPALRLHSGRVLDANNECNTSLIENQVEEAVRFFVNEHGCRVFNLSFGDANKPYNGGHVRGLSVTLDTLSRELGVLFVVSTGNYRLDEDSPSGTEWREDYPDYLLRDAWRIIEPAPALNVLTVGGLAKYDRSINSQRYRRDPSQLPIASPEQPSPFTLHGSSVDGAIKPELLAHGGTWALSSRGGAFSLMDKGAGLGVLSTNREFAGGRPFAIHAGTSYAAPQIAHMAAVIIREYPDADTNTVRALLCLNASMPEACQELLENQADLRRVCGYGKVDPEALYRSLEDSATMLATGTIENKRHHFYEVPIPEGFLSSGRRTRELAVALAYTPAVRTTRLKYRASRIDFRVVIAPDLDTVSTMFSNETKEDDYENIPEFKTGLIGQRARSKGTVQADCWQFSQFNRNSRLRQEKLFVVVTRNDYAWGESINSTDEGYSLAIAFRDRENAEARLYSQIRTQLRSRVATRIRI